jgi:hypothetical protein
MSQKLDNFKNVLQLLLRTIRDGERARTRVELELKRSGSRGKEISNSCNGEKTREVVYRGKNDRRRGRKDALQRLSSAPFSQPERASPDFLLPPMLVYLYKLSSKPEINAVKACTNKSLRS